MADPYQPVKTGQSIDISARSFNGALKAGQDYSRRKLDDGNSQRDGRGIDPVSPPQAFNGLTAAIDEFSVLGFGVVPTIDTAGVPFEASSSPVFTAALPDAAAPFCITREPIPVGSLGQVVTNGPAVVKVNITDATHTRAVPITGDKTQLTSAASGGVPILDRETGTGVKWAKVLVGDQNADSPTYYNSQLVADPPPNAYAQGTYNGAFVGQLIVPSGDYLVTAFGGTAIVGNPNFLSGSILYYIGVSAWNYPGPTPAGNAQLYAPHLFSGTTSPGNSTNTPTTGGGNFNISTIIPAFAVTTPLMAIGVCQSVASNGGTPAGTLGLSCSVYNLSATRVKLTAPVA